MYKILLVSLLCISLLCIFTIASTKSSKIKSTDRNKGTASQEPGLPCKTEEVAFENSDADITLRGTLSLPHGNIKHPAVILISGYGSTDRDLTGMGHKRFKVLADHITLNGFAVLRYDKRGVGQSTGTYEIATTIDFAEDVKAAIAYLRSRNDIDLNHIGLIGLSEGGLIASIVAAESKDIAFIVLMAPAVITSVNDLIDFTALQLKADGASDSFVAEDRKIRRIVYSIVKQEDDPTVAEAKLTEAIAHYLRTQSDTHKNEANTLPFALTQEKASMLIKTFNSPWYRFYLKYDPQAVLENITVPVLVINGDHDWIVTPEKVFPVLRHAFEKAGNKHYDLVELAGLNHAFQHCQTGSIAEYGMIKETIAPVALETITEWLRKQLK